MPKILFCIFVASIFILSTVAAVNSDSAEFGNPSQKKFTYPSSSGAFSHIAGYWDQAFKRNEIYHGDNVNRVGFCYEGTKTFGRCMNYPAFGYPYYHMTWNGAGGIRFWQ